MSESPRELGDVPLLRAVVQHSDEGDMLASLECRCGARIADWLSAEDDAEVVSAMRDSGLIADSSDDAPR